MFLSNKRDFLTVGAFLVVLVVSLVLVLRSFPHVSHSGQINDENHSRSRRSFLMTPHKTETTQNDTKRNTLYFRPSPPKGDNNKNSNHNKAQGESTLCQINLNDRFDCFPENPNPNPDACRARDCCYDNTKGGKSPACFFSQGAGAYRVVSLGPIKDSGGSVVGWNASLVRNTSSPYPSDVTRLTLLVLFETEYRLRFKLYDPTTPRYEVPVNLHDNNKPTPGELTHYTVNITWVPFSISILRKADGQPLFDSRGVSPLIFADQYLQIGSRLSSPYIYGLGNHRSSLLLNVSDWQKLTFWNGDHPPQVDENLYGSHPFYLNLEPSGKAHGVFLLNSNALQVDLQPYQKLGAVTYRALGGVLDFFVLTGPSPETVVQQYVGLIGLPYFPPLWALGFQLCRHSYGNSSELWKVIERNRAARIPYDVQWNDFDYSRDNLVWTWDNHTYRGLPDIIADLHAHGQHNVIITEPGVSNTQSRGSYLPFDLGVKLDVFMKNATGGMIIGEVWPGEQAFIDFFHPKAQTYWLTMITMFHKVLPFDGLWIDMNEPSNFINGSTYGCTNNTLDIPPFIPPGIVGGSMFSKTLCPSAQQYLSSHYNLHNLYGWSQISLTMRSLELMCNKRTLVLSRSTAPGSGQHGAHWTGDNYASFSDMYYSITAILTANMFGMSLMGAEVCGFRGNARREMCIRWHQLGAFYPFMRNHAEIGTVPQDPAVWDKEAQTIMRSALELRYSLLPFLYTRFYLSHTTGVPCVRPLFFDYPGTEAIDRQFLWGSELLISPVLEEGARSVRAYIPKGSWFDLQNLTLVKVKGGSWHELSAPLDTINVHVRGGSILPMVPPAVTTTRARQKKMELLVAPDMTSDPVSAKGQLYWDDGDTLEPVTRATYSLVAFSLTQSTLTSEVKASGYGPVTLGKVTVMGVDHSPANVTLNNQAVPFTYHPPTQVLDVWGLGVDLLSPFSLTWH